MPLSKQVPEHLETSQYFKLAIQYMLMGWSRQAVKAGRMALSQDSEELAGTPFEDMSERDIELFRRAVEGIDEGFTVGNKIYGVSRSLAGVLVDQVESTNLRADEYLSDRDTLRSIKFGMEESLKSLTKSCGFVASKLAGAALRATQPPRELPGSLPREHYLTLANRYLQLGWSEQARDALNRAIEMGREGHVSRRARRILNCRVPKEPIPYLALERLAEIRRMALIGKTREALEAAKELINTYPTFEWPYVRAAEYSIHLGEIDQALDCVDRAIELNDSYIDAWIVRAKIKAIEDEILESQLSLDRACELDSDCREIPYLRQLISLLVRVH